jgi:hypothetical protein
MAFSDVASVWQMGTYILEKPPSLSSLKNKMEAAVSSKTLGYRLLKIVTMGPACN